MHLPSPSVLKAFAYVERRLSPRIEAWVRTDLFLDAVAAANSLSRRSRRALEGTIANAVETVGLPSARQVRALQRSLDELTAIEEAKPMHDQSRLARPD